MKMFIVFYIIGTLENLDEARRSESTRFLIHIYNGITLLYCLELRRLYSVTTHKLFSVFIGQIY